MSDPSIPVRYSRPCPKAVRLTLVYKFGSDSFELIDVQRLEMIVPASDRVRADQRIGSWVDLINDQHQILFRRSFQLPASPSVEVHSPEKGRPPSRVKSEARQFLFVVLVPDSDEGKQVAVYHGAAVARSSANSELKPTHFEIDS
jgi:hypothetical protein